MDDSLISAYLVSEFETIALDQWSIHRLFHPLLICIIVEESSMVVLLGMKLLSQVVIKSAGQISTDIV